MQELSFEQVVDVDGGCAASEVMGDFVKGSFAFAGGLIGGATSFGFGAPLGGFAGGMAGSLAWVSMRSDFEARFCEMN